MCTRKTYDDNELAPIATIKKFLIVQKEGERKFHEILLSRFIEATDRDVL